jgi:hypothetical protein
LTTFDGSSAAPAIGECEQRPGRLKERNTFAIRLDPDGSRDGDPLGGGRRAERAASECRQAADFFISEEGLRLFRDSDYIPVAPDVPPRNRALRPDGKTFRAIFFTPEQIEASMPHWMENFKDTFH